MKNCFLAWYAVFLVIPSGLVQAQADALQLSESLAVEKNFRSGYYFYNRREYTAAVSFFDQAISVNPHDHRSRIWLGQSFYMAGFQKNAMTEWQVALNLGAGGSLLRNKLKNVYAIETREDAYDEASPWIFLKGFDGYRDKSLFVRPSGLAIDENRNLYIAGFASGKVSILDPNGNLLNVLMAGLSKPYDLAFAPTEFLCFRFRKRFCCPLFTKRTKTGHHRPPRISLQNWLAQKASMSTRRVRSTLPIPETIGSRNLPRENT